MHKNMYVNYLALNLNYIGNENLIFKPEFKNIGIDVLKPEFKNIGIDLYKPEF